MRRLVVPMIAVTLTAAGWCFPAKPVQHVQLYGAVQCDGILSVSFDLQRYDRRASAWESVPDDGAVVVQVSTSYPNDWTTLATGSGGENRLRAAHPDDAATPGNLAVRVVHRGIASSARIADLC